MSSLLCLYGVSVVGSGTVALSVRSVSLQLQILAGSTGREGRTSFNFRCYLRDELTHLSYFSCLLKKRCWMSSGVLIDRLLSTNDFDDVAVIVTLTDIVQKVDLHFLCSLGKPHSAVPKLIL